MTILFHAPIATLDFDSTVTILMRLTLSDSSTLSPKSLSIVLAEDEFDKAFDLPWSKNLLSYIEDFLVRKAFKILTTTFYNPPVPQHNKLLIA